MRTALVIHGDGMGRGDEALGARLLRTFLTKAGAALPGLEAVVFYNAGVKLLADGSEHLQALAALEERGVDLIACGTCVDHFDLRARIRAGRVQGMDDILVELARAEKVITL